MKNKIEWRESSFCSVIDFKEVSLSLYNKEVLIIVKVSSQAYHTFGSEIHGRLTGRHWGKRVTLKNVLEPSMDTVKSISITKDDGTIIEILCDEIKYISEAR